MLLLGTCVYSLILKVCVSYQCCMFEYPLTYCINVQVANSKLQKRLQSQFHAHREEKQILLSQNQDLRQELAALKVIVVYIHQVYITVRLYYFCHARGSSECKFSACCAAFGMSLRSVVTIEGGVMQIDWLYIVKGREGTDSNTQFQVKCITIFTGSLTV